MQVTHFLMLTGGSLPELKNRIMLRWLGYGRLVSVSP